jgi:hypothetical protein
MDSSRYCPLHNSVKSKIFVNLSRDLVPVPNNSPAKAAGPEGAQRSTCVSPSTLLTSMIAGVPDVLLIRMV